VEEEGIMGRPADVESDEIWEELQKSYPRIEITWATTLQASKDRMIAAIKKKLAQKPLVPTGPRPAAWNDIAGIGAAELPSSLDQANPGYWFNYFWKEAKEAAKSDSGIQARLLDVFNWLFEKEGEVRVNVKIDTSELGRDYADQRRGNPDYEVTAAGEVFKKESRNKYRLKESWEDLARTKPNELKAQLQTLLEIGFIRMPATRGKHAEMTSDDTRDAQMIDVLQGKISEFTRRQKKGPTPDQIEVGIGWRGDSRAFDTIRQEDGFFRKCDPSKGYAPGHGLTAAWNPLSDPQNQEFFWFRKNQNDNCLFTVISVGEHEDYRAFLPFPKFQDQGSPRPFPVWVRIDGKDNYTLTLPGYDNWLYLCIYSGVVLDTQGLQLREVLPGERNAKAGSFPERGQRKIKMKNIFGGLRFVKFFHDPSDNEGLTAVLDYRTIRLTSDFIDLSTRSARFKKAAPELERRFRKATRDGVVHLKWTPTGFATVPAAFTYQGHQIEITRLGSEIEARNQKDIVQRNFGITPFSP
jgi:hypothetical protein